MKRKLVEQTEPRKTRKKGKIVTAQAAGEILILNIFQDRKLLARYCMDSRSYEYAALDMAAGGWNGRKFEGIFDGKKLAYYSGYLYEREVTFDRQEDRELISTMLKKESWRNDVIQLLDSREREYSSDVRERKEFRRRDRVKAVMAKVPEIPRGIEDWISRQAAGDKAYFFLDKEKAAWSCTACGKRIPEKKLKRSDGGRVRHGDNAVCPGCGKTCQAVRRTDRKKILTHFCLIQPMDEEMGVARHFDVGISWDAGGRHVRLSEAMRITLFRPKCRRYEKLRCDIYYSQTDRSWDFENPHYTEGNFDNVKDCQYTVPGYWDIGEVYERLIEDSYDDENIVDGIWEVYHSWIDGKISDYNTDFYYQPRDYIAECYKAGEIL